MCSSSHSNGSFLLELSVNFFFPQPNFLSLLHFSFTLLLFPLFPAFCPLILWLFKDMEQRHVSSHLRTFRSQKERLTRSPGFLCTHQHAKIHSNTPELNYQIPNKELHSHKAKRHREKQRDGMFSPNPPLSFSLSRSCYSPQYFSAVQYKHEE